jgi:hypothetical protein
MIGSRCANPVTREKGGLKYLKNHLKTFYSEGTRKLEQRSIKPIEAGRQYRRRNVLTAV